MSGAGKLGLGLENVAGGGVFFFTTEGTEVTEVTEVTESGRVCW